MSKQQDDFASRIRKDMLRELQDHIPSRSRRSGVNKEPDTMLFLKRLFCRRAVKQGDMAQFGLKQVFGRDEHYEPEA